MQIICGFVFVVLFSWVFFSFFYFLGIWRTFLINWDTENTVLKICHQKQTSLCEIIPLHLHHHHHIFFQARQPLTIRVSRHTKLFLIKVKKGWTLLMTLWNIKGKKSRIIKINISQFGQKILNCPVRLLSHSDSMQIKATYRLFKLHYSSNECRIDEFEKQAPWKKILENVNFNFIHVLLCMGADIQLSGCCSLWKR